MSELTLPDADRSNTVKQLDRRNRGNLKYKYMLFLVQISMQMHSHGWPRATIVHGRTGVAKAMDGRERPPLATSFNDQKFEHPSLLSMLGMGVSTFLLKLAVL